MSTQPASQVPQLAGLAKDGSIPAVGKFTNYYAQKTVLGMKRLVLDMKPELTQVQAWEQVLDAVINTGQAAPSEAHRHDARLMYRAARSYWMGAKQGW